MIEAVKDIYAGIPARPAAMVPAGLGLRRARVFPRLFTPRPPPGDAQNT